jgi:integrase/recombinase XerD
MNTRHIKAEQYIGRFLKSVRFRYHRSGTVYRCMLRTFLRDVSVQRGGTPRVNEETLRAWLQARGEQNPAYTVYRVQLIDRFLRWMKQSGHIADNPFDQLRGQYGGRIAPIVRALCNPDSAAALDKLRTLPAFGSPWGTQMREYVELMRSLGYRYKANEEHLKRFDRFLQRRPDLAGQPLPTLIEAWQQAGSGVEHALTAQRCGRMLSKAQHRHDPNAAIIPWDPALAKQVLAEHRHPYIYTPEQIETLLATARVLPSPRASLRPLSVYMMFVLGYCAGLRLSEIVKPTLADVNLHEGTLEIRDTKFFKSRRLSLTPSVVEALRDYMKARRKAGAPMTPTAALFWNQTTNRGYSRVTVQALMIEVARRAGLKPERGRIGPRIHDLRHSMVHSRMLTWYQEGINPQSRLPHLATYLGHKGINSTLVYMTITPQLMQLASERSRKHSAHVVRLQEALS